MPALILVRHAQGSFGTADYDVLSPDGNAQAEAVAAELATRELTVTRLLSGSLRRQRDTAAPIAQRFGLEVGTDPRLNEYDSDGILAHHSTSSAREDHAPGDDTPVVSSREFQAVLEAAQHAWIAAGEAGAAPEPWPAFTARCTAALTDAAAGLGGGETAIVCTSGGVIAAICVALLAVDPRTMVAFNRVAINTAMTKVAVGRGGMTLIAFNEHGHLERPGAPPLTYR